MQYANINTENTVLEPSAGQGSIIDAILRAHPDQRMIFYCEKMDINRVILSDRYGKKSEIIPLNVKDNDFLNLSSVAHSFDRIVANPPFSKNQDIDHVKHMYSMLNTGGRLVAIMSKHWQLSENKKESEFKDWLDWIDSEVIEIEAGAFKNSGTNIASVIVIINK